MSDERQKEWIFFFTFAEGLGIVKTVVSRNEKGGGRMKEVAEYAPYQEELVCEHKKTMGGMNYPYHRHDGYEVFLFLEGNVQFYLEENCYEAKQGDLAVMSPFNMHRIVAQNQVNYERITINMRKEVIERMSTEETDLFACFSLCDNSCMAPITLSDEQRDRFVELTDRLSVCLKQTAYGTDIRVRNLLSEILLMVNECFENVTNVKKSIMPELVRDMMLYIQKNVTEELSLEQLAKVFYHNGTYLSRTFKKHTGLSLHVYILDRRIEHAKQMLRKGSSVSDACFSSGFSDYSNFIRNFTNKVGSSPGKWGKENRI